MNSELLIQLLVNGIIVGMLYGIVAMCFVLIYKSTQVVNFAQGEFVVMGAWVCLSLVVSMGLPFWLAFLFTLAFMTAFGVLVQMILLRPLVGEPVISIIMATIGLSTFMRALMNWIFGNSAVSFPNVFNQSVISIAGLNVETAYVLSLVLSVAVMGLFFSSSATRAGGLRCGRQPIASR